MIKIGDFLRRGGTDKAGVLAAVEVRLELAMGDIILAAGSLAEGLGTVKSDLDLFLITGREAAGEEQDEVILSVGTCVIDVRILPRRRIAELLARLEAWALGPWDPSNAARFSHDERVLLHRLARGLVWATQACAGGEGDFRPPIEHLSLLKLHVARHAAKTIQVDLEGYRQVGDYQTMAFSAQKLLGHAIDGFLAGRHYTNPISKWRSRLLADVPKGWQEALLCRATGLSAPEIYWQLQHFPDHPDERVLPYADRVLAFSRAAFLWAEATLLGLPAVVRGPWAFPDAKRSSAAPLAPLLPDVDFSLTPTGAMAARLNEFGTVLGLTTEELALALLFDGITTPAEAARAVYGGALAPAEAERRVDTLATRFSAAGLCRTPDPSWCHPGPDDRRTGTWTR